MNRVRITIPFVVFLVMAMAGCSRTVSSSQPEPNPGVPVTVAKAVEKRVPIELHEIGTVEAYSTVSVKAQVSAPVEAVHFREGQDVKKGQLLFTLDRRPFAAALQQAEANLARDEAQAENAAAQARRYAKLFADGVASKEQYDQIQATSDASQAAVRADQAAVEYAKLQLQYCAIDSPIDGRTGGLMVHPGNLVKANDVPVLVVINQIQPIYVDFSVPEQYLTEVKKYMAGGSLRVEASPRDSAGVPDVGKLSFIDNAVDNTTGTIKLKGIFSNPHRRLWPGQFVNVVLRLAEERNAVVVPSQAVETGQDGQYVFVVKPDLTAESRRVVVSRTVNGQAVVEKGLQSGETVVTDGQLRLVPGIRVQVKSGIAGT